LIEGLGGIRAIANWDFIFRGRRGLWFMNRVPERIERYSKHEPPSV
jgi:hypothetical protein